MKLIKEVVKNSLWKKKITLGQLAEELGITQQSLSKIFSKNSTTIEMLEKMAQILEIDTGEFFPSNNKVEEPQEEFHEPTRLQLHSSLCLQYLWAKRLSLPNEKISTLIFNLISTKFIKH